MEYVLMNEIYGRFDYYPDKGHAERAMVRARKTAYRKLSRSMRFEDIWETISEHIYVSPVHEAA